MIRETSIARSVRLVCLGTLALGIQQAHAQTTAPEGPVQQVMVTGSRIASPNAESASPLQVLNAADIAASGVTNLQELLLKNPTLGTPTVSRTNSNFSTSSAGVSTVDLRNLGTARTLVLLNGRRFVSGIPGESAVDLNVIPTDFIERVELLTGGASATYGSDAVAGVVNIILKKNFNGLLLDASGGQSTKHDDTKKKFSATFGTTSADGNSNIMGHFGYTKQGAVYSKDRAASAIDQNTKGDPDDIFAVNKPFYSGYAPQGRFFHDTGSYTYDRAGNPIPWNQNGTGGAAATGFNRSEFRTIAVPTDRYLFALNGNLALSENHSAFFEGTYAATRVTTKLEPFPLDSGNIYANGQVPAEFHMPDGAGGFKVQRNPLVPQYLYDRISDTDGDGLADYFFTRRMSEVGNRGSRADRDTFRLATGLKGQLWKDWSYEAYVAYGQTKESQTSGGQVNTGNFRNALEAITDVDDLNGNGLTNDIICRDATARSQGCAPINVFGFNSISADALRYVTAPGSLNTAITQKLAGASVTGEAFQLPAGPLGIAAGFEYRGEDSRAEPDALTQAGLNAGNALPPTYGRFNVREAYVEARAPLLKGKPFVEELTFNGAFRRGDYSTVGYTSSWNAGLEWRPVADVKFRATRALSTRAPNINELFQGPQQTFPADISDPCVGVGLTGGGARGDACRAAPGVLANIQANGVFTLNQADIQGISGFDRGNPNLQEEKGRSTTIGVVWTPRAIPVLNKFTFTADYFDIKIADAIVPVPRQFALENCYGGDGTFCNTIIRRPARLGANSSGSLEFIDSAVNNSGGKATEGVDFTASFADRVGPGRLSARLAWTWLREGYDIPLPGAEKDYWAGEIGSAKNRGSLNLAYKWGKFGISGSTTFISKSALDDQFLVSVLEVPRNSIRVGSKTYQDFQFTYAPWKQTEFYLGIDNAFDTKAPPIVSGLPSSVTGAETDSGTYDAIGRRYYLGVRVTL